MGLGGASDHEIRAGANAAAAVAAGRGEPSNVNIIDDSSPLTSSMMSTSRASMLTSSSSTTSLLYGGGNTLRTFTPLHGHRHHRRPKTTHSHHHQHRSASPASRQPGEGPYNQDSLAARSVAVQANPAPYRRFYLPKQNDSGVVNSFFHHFDVLDVDAMPTGAPDIPQTTYLKEPVPEYLEATYQRFYYANQSHSAQSGGPPVPEVRMFTSRDLRNDSIKTAVDPLAVGIELHDLSQYVGHVRPRSYDDTVPLLQLAQGLLLHCSDELALMVARWGLSLSLSLCLVCSYLSLRLPMSI